jgi:hypothetical protein
MLLSLKEFHINHPIWSLPVVLDVNLNMQNSEIMKYTLNNDK